MPIAATGSPTSPIDRLRAIMGQLRNPDGGCEWDLAQDFATIAPYPIGEAYEVADASAVGDPAEICDELGDLRLQGVFHAPHAADYGHDAMDAVPTRPDGT